MLGDGFKEVTDVLLQIFRNDRQGTKELEGCVIKAREAEGAESMSMRITNHLDEGGLDLTNLLDGTRDDLVDEAVEKNRWEIAWVSIGWGPEQGAEKRLPLKVVSRLHVQGNWDVLAEDNSILEGLVERAGEGLASDGLDPLLSLSLELGVVRRGALLGELSIQSCVQRGETLVKLSKMSGHAAHHPG